MLTEKLYRDLEFVAQLAPASFYWLDARGTFLGLNDHVVRSLGATKKEDILGKTIYELYLRELADIIQENIDEILLTKKFSKTEDKIMDIGNGRIRYFSATLCPIF